MKFLTLIAKATAILVAGLVAIWFFYDYLLIAILSVIAILYVVFYDGSHYKSATNNSFDPREQELDNSSVPALPDYQNYDNYAQWENSQGRD